MNEDDYLNELFDKYDPDEIISMMFANGLTLEEFRDRMKPELKRIYEDEDGR